MEEFLLNIFQMPLLCGVIFMITGSIVYFFPPKKINYLYGYRTTASMQSQERWDFAQKFSSVQMIKGGVFLMVISFFGLLIPINEDAKFIIGIILAILPCIYIFRTTEKEIKQRFNS
jgi:uncharacterized membrane protein